MKSTVLLLALVTVAANAQSPVDKPADSETTRAKKVDPKLHTDAVKLVDLSGAKQLLQDNFEKMVDEAEKTMMDKCKECNPEFGKEWKKRFLERANINDYLDVYVRAYEKYFTDAEINELIALQKDKTAAPSPALKEKLTSVMPGLMADIIGDCTKIGAKLGGEIGQEIGREHPEYTKPPANAANPTQHSRNRGSHHSGFQTWADDFTGDLQNVFSFQEQVALKIADALNLHLSPQEQEAVKRRYTQNPQAYLSRCGFSIGFDREKSRNHLQALII